MTIRPFSPNDTDACARIFMAAYNQMPWNYRWEHDKAVKYLTEYAGAQNFTGLVAEDNGVVCGAMFGHIKTWWTNDQLFIDELFVDGTKQGRGIGKQIMAHCEAICKEKGIEMITLMTNKLMPAYEFYITNDYSKVDQYVFMFKEL